MKKVAYILLFVSSLGLAQDIHFSQIQECPLWLNPANAGFMNGYFRAVANYRNQWMAMGNAYQTMAVSVDAALLKKDKGKGYLGVGLFVFNDAAGAAKIGTTQGQLHINGIIKTGDRSKLGGAVYVGFNQNKANYTSLTFGTQYNGKEIDNTLGTGEIATYHSFMATDVGAGINYEFSSAKVQMLRDDIFSLKIGAAVHHLNRPVQKFSTGSEYRLPMRFVGNIQARIDIKGTKVAILPSVIYLSQATASEITAGTQIRYRFKNPTKVTGVKSETSFNIGVYYRVKDAVIPQINLDMGKYAIGLGYDLNISAYKQVSKMQGGFEVYLKFLMPDDALFKRKREYSL